MENSIISEYQILSSLFRSYNPRLMASSADGFRPLAEKSLLDYIKATPSLALQLGNQFHDLQIKEVGDGNLNFVYIVIGPSGSLVIKQVTSYFFSLFPSIY